MNARTIAVAAVSACAGAAIMLGGVAGAAAGQPATTVHLTAAPTAKHVTCTVPGNNSPVPALRYVTTTRTGLRAWADAHGTSASNVLEDTIWCGPGWPLQDKRLVASIDNGGNLVVKGTVLYVLKI